MTFSVLGHCNRTGMLGVAVTTSSICVGARCPWVRAGIGAVSTQNVTLPSIGPMVLDQIGHGMSAGQAIDQVIGRIEHREYRQVAAIDNRGRGGIYSGDKTLGTHAATIGNHCVAAGNLLRDSGLPDALVERFHGLAGSHLAERLLSSLEAGIHEAGGEEGPVHSAALLVHSDHGWPLVDLRVDWDESDPVGALRALWTDYEPQMNDYVLRALDPAQAPSYGVPGDE